MNKTLTKLWQGKHYHTTTQMRRRCYCKILFWTSFWTSSSNGFLLPACLLTVTLLTQHPRHCAKRSGKPTVSSQHPRSSPQALFIMLVSSSGANCIPIIPFKEWNEEKQRNVDPRDIKGPCEQSCSPQWPQLGNLFLSLLPWLSEHPPWIFLHWFPAAPSSSHFFFLMTRHTLKELTGQKWSFINRAGRKLFLG